MLAVQYTNVCGLLALQKPALIDMRTLKLREAVYHQDSNILLWIVDQLTCHVGVRRGTSESVNHRGQGQIFLVCICKLLLQRNIPTCQSTKKEKEENSCSSKKLRVPVPPRRWSLLSRGRYRLSRLHRRRCPFLDGGKYQLFQFRGGLSLWHGECQKVDHWTELCEQTSAFRALGKVRLCLL